MADTDFNPISYAAANIPQFRRNSHLAGVIRKAWLEEQADIRAKGEKNELEGYTRALIDTLELRTLNHQRFTPRDFLHAWFHGGRARPAHTEAERDAWAARCTEISLALQRHLTANDTLENKVLPGSALARIPHNRDAEEAFLIAVSNKGVMPPGDGLAIFGTGADLAEKSKEIRDAVERGERAHEVVSSLAFWPEENLSQVYQGIRLAISHGEFDPRLEEDFLNLLHGHMQFGAPEITEWQVRKLFEDSARGSSLYGIGDPAPFTAGLNAAIADHMAVSSTFDDTLNVPGDPKMLLVLNKEFGHNSTGRYATRKHAVNVEFLRLAARHLDVASSQLGEDEARDFLKRTHLDPAHVPPDVDVQSLIKNFNDGLDQVRAYRHEIAGDAAKKILEAHVNGQPGADIFKEKARYIATAAQHGNGDAQFIMGLVRQNGWDGQPANHRDAYEWYRHAANQDHIGGMAGAARLWRDGFEGWPSNPEAASVLMRNAASAHQRNPIDPAHPMHSYYQRAVGEFKEQGLLGRFAAKTGVQALWNRVARRATTPAAATPAARAKKSWKRRAIIGVTAAAIAGAAVLVTSRAHGAANNNISPDLSAPAPKKSAGWLHQYTRS
jgi:TPR repeat protein